MVDLADAVRRADALSAECPTCTSRVVSPQRGSTVGWECADCGLPLTLSIERSDAETEVLALLNDEDLASGDPGFALFRRGVTIRFLNSFTTRFGCWNWPTWRVVRNLVRPATASTRTRYFNIVKESNPEECGLPDVFISHSWAARWGTLVGAASYGSRSGDRRVWLDAFAVRQWPHGETDLNFKAVVHQCKSLIIAIDHDVVEKSKLGDLETLTTRQDVTVRTVLIESVRRKLPLARSWCLAEIVAAYVDGRPVVALIGESITDTSEAKGRQLKLPRSAAQDQAIVRGSWSPDRTFAISNFGLVEVLYELIRLEDAETTLESDRLRINADVEVSMGYERFNSAARATLLGASLDVPEAEVALPLVCDGDDQPLRLRASQGSGVDRARLLATLAGLGATSALTTLADEYRYDLEDGSMPALWAASSYGQLDIARTLVDHYHVSVEGRAGNRMTPLAAAATAGHHELVDFLLARGAAVDARARLDRSALINAAMWGHARVVSLLGRAGADPDLLDAEGYSALAHAIFGRHTAATQALISDCAADVNLQAGPANFSALHWAARHGLYDIAAVLVANGANVDARAEDGTTPLITAVLSGSTETALLLLRAGAQIDVTNDSGFGILAAAVTNGDPSVLQAVVAEVPREKYGDLKDQRFQGQWNALDLAILASNPAMVTLIVEAIDWDIRRMPREGLPAIFLAVMSTKDESAESLATLSAIMNCGADVTARDADGASVLFVCRSARALAVFSANPTAKAVLTSIVDDRIGDGRAALHVAAASNLDDVVRVLVTDLGAHVDLPGPSGATPLTLAVRHDAKIAAQALLDLGADPRICAPNGMTLQEVAETYASEEMVALVNRLSDD